MSLIKELQDLYADTDIKATTLNNRIAFLNKISNGSATIDFINDYDRIIKLLNTYDNINTRWNNLMHIQTTISRDNGKVINDKAREAYSKYIAELKEVRSEHNKNNVQTEVQKAKYTETYDDFKNKLTEAIDKLFKEYGINSAFNVSTVGEKIREFAKKFQPLVMLSAYLYQEPLRSNWSSMQISYKKDEMDNVNNWLYIAGGHYTLYMNDFKTVKTFGQVKLPLNDQFRDILKIWFAVLKEITKHKPHYVMHFMITPNKPVRKVMSDAGFGKAIVSASKKLFNKPLSINDYRHLYEIQLQNSPEYSNMTIKEKEKIHHKLLHSMNTSLYYNVI